MCNLAHLLVTWRVLGVHGLPEDHRKLVLVDLRDKILCELLGEKKAFRGLASRLPNVYDGHTQQPQRMYFDNSRILATL